MASQLAWKPFSTVHLEFPLKVLPLTTTVWPLIIKNINDIEI